MSVTANNGVAASWGIHHYLKYFCGVHMSWDVDQLGELRAVAQLAADRLLLMPVLFVSNPAIGKILYCAYLLLTVEKTKIKKKRPEMAHLKTLICNFTVARFEEFSPLLQKVKNNW